MDGRVDHEQSGLVRLVADLLDELEGTVVTECEFRAGEHRILVKRSLSTTTVAPPAEMTPLDDIIPESWRPVLSPLTGIFFSTESPQSPPFVSLGSVVSEKQVVGLIESMKMYNPVETDVAGVVRSIEVQASAVVEKGQVLMYIEPTGDIA
jgi:acetyl-CoA carboxylase biotin carboxyl carrier protein